MSILDQIIDAEPEVILGKDKGKKNKPKIQRIKHSIYAFKNLFKILLD